MASNLGLGITFTAKDLASGVMGGLRNNLQGVSQTANASARSMEGASRVLSDMSKGVAMAGAAATAVGGVLLAVFSAATTEAAHFGKQVAEISSIADQAEFPMSKISSMLLGLSAQFGGDVADQAKALYQGISAGASTAAAAASLMTSANQLAIAGVTDVRTSVDGLTNTLNAFGLSYDNATKVGEAFFTAARLGKTTVGDLAKDIGKVAPTAAAMNVSMTDVLASISTITTKGLATAEAITGLKAALAGVIQPSANATAEAKRLGITFDSAALRSKGLAGLLDSVTSSSKFNADTFSKLFSSVEAFNAIQALTAGGSAQFKTTLDAMRNSAGALDVAFDKMSNTTAFQMEQFAGLKKAAMITIGQALEPIAVAVLKVVNTIIRGFTAIPAPVRNVIINFAAAAAAAMTFAGSAVGIVAAIVALDVPLAAMAAGFAGILVVMAPVIATIGVLGLAVKGLREAWERNVGGIRDTVLGLWSKVTLAYDGMAQVFESGRLSGAVLRELNKAENQGIKNFVVTAYVYWNRLKGFIEGVSKGFSAAIDAMRPTFTVLSQSLSDLGDAFLRLFGGPNNPAANAEKLDRFSSAGAKVGAVLAKVAEWAAKAITWVVQLGTGLLDGAGKGSAGFTRLWNSISQVGTSFGMLISAASDVVDALTGTSNSGKSTGEQLAAIFSVMASTTAQALKQIAVPVRGLAVTLSFLAKMWAVVSGAVDSTTSSISAAAQEIASFIDKMAGFLGIATDLSSLVGGFGGGGPKVSAFSGPNGASTGATQATTVGISSAGFPSASPSAAGTSPGVAAAQATSSEGGSGAAMQAAIREGFATASRAPSGPTNLTIPVMLDGEKIAEVIARRDGSNSARSYQVTAAAG